MIVKKDALVPALLLLAFDAVSLVGGTPINDDYSSLLGKKFINRPSWFATGNTGPRFVERAHDGLRHNENIRHLQSIGIGAGETTASGPNFKATYLARFSHWADEGCGGPAPVIQAFCFGDITPQSISNEAIKCSALSSDEWSGIQCSIECTGVDCEGIYLERQNIGSADESQFGEIVFNCEGANVEDVDAYMIYVGGENGECSPSTTSGTESRNFHVGQLGVFCADSGDDGAYRFDDGDFECGLGAIVAPIGGIYTCLQGDSCEGEACTVEFPDLVIEADRQNFHECVEKVGSEEVPEEPAKEDLITPAAEGQYVATFQAQWQLFMNTSVCGGNFATKRIQCTNGDIALVETLADDVTCNVTQSAMECIDATSDNFLNSFSGAVFTCTSTDAVPSVEVEYLSADAKCIASEVSNAVVHYIVLGVNCEDSTNGAFTSYADYLFECGEDNSYDTLDGKYTCATFQVFEPGDAEELRPVPVASVHTDFRWSQGDFDFCYQFTSSGNGGNQGTDAPGTDDCDGNGGIGLGQIGIGTGSDCPEDVDLTEGDSTPPPTSETVIIETSVPQTSAPSAPAPAPTTQSPTEAPVPDVPTEAVPGTTYSAGYKARFKRVIDDGCEGPPEADVIAVVCERGEIELVGTSDTSIVCTPPEDLESGEGQLMACAPTCQGAACDELYIDRDSIFLFGIWDLDPNLYAEVEFRCSKLDDVNGVDASLYMPGSESIGSGSCSGTAERGDGYNFLMTELNVLCDDGTGEAVYVNDDAYMECSLDVFPFNVNGAYSCMSGQACLDTSCVVDYADTVVEADHQRFRHCIQTDNDSGVPEPNAPVQEDQVAGQYTARFQLGAAYEFDENNCETSFTGLKAECLDGTIELVTDSADKTCTKISDSEIECTEDVGSIVNEFVDVLEYDCTSIDTVPTTRVEYYSADLTCASSANENGQRSINLGVRCGDPGDEAYSSFDFFFECEKDNVWSTQTDDNRFTCTSSIQIPKDSDGTPYTIPPAVAFTDYRWLFYSSERCYSFKAGATATARMQSKMADVVKASKTKLTSVTSSSTTTASSTANIDMPFSNSHGHLSSAAPSFGLVSFLVTTVFVVASSATCYA